MTHHRAVPSITGRLPDFLIIGAQKSATTWLKEQLRCHSAIHMARREVHFFDRPRHFALGAEWYASHFAGARPDQVVGEKTPEYLYLSQRSDIPEGVGRVHDLLPDARLIIIFRDPVRRALSALNHMIHKQHVSPLYSADALLLGRKRHLVDWPILEMGIYHRQLAPYLAAYGRKAVLALFYEDDVVGTPRETVVRVCRFLDLHPETDTEQLERRLNRPRRTRPGLAVRYYAPVLAPLVDRYAWRFPKYYPRLSASGRRELARFYAPHNEALFEMLGRRPRSGWLSDP